MLELLTFLAVAGIFICAVSVAINVRDMRNRIVLGDQAEAEQVESPSWQKRVSGGLVLEEDLRR